MLTHKKELLQNTHLMDKLSGYYLLRKTETPFSQYYRDALWDIK